MDKKRRLSKMAKEGFAAASCRMNALGEIVAASLNKSSKYRRNVRLVPMEAGEISVPCITNDLTVFFPEAVETIKAPAKKLPVDIQSGPKLHPLVEQMCRKHNIKRAFEGNSFDLWLECNECRCVWRPETKRGNVLKRGCWRCPQGCNTGQAVSKTDNSSGENF